MATTSEHKLLILTFSHDAREAKTQIIPFSLCDVRRIQYWIPDRWCLIATTGTLGMFSHVLLDPSFLLRLSVSVVTHLEKLSGVFSYCKRNTWKCIHIKLPSQHSLMFAMWCRQGCSLAPQVACFLPHTRTWNHHTIFHSSLSPPACLWGFFLSHSCSAGAFNSQICSQIFPNVSCEAKKGFCEFDWSGCHKPG